MNAHGASGASGGGAGALGTLFTTSLRLVWHANAGGGAGAAASGGGLSVSLPLLQVRSLRVADSKWGPCLVVEAAARAGGYVLGFRCEQCCMRVHAFGVSLTGLLCCLGRAM